MSLDARMETPFAFAENYMNHTTHEGWRFRVRTEYVEQRLVKYTVSCFEPADDWYDEIRYDSHDRRKGKSVLGPHFHLKLRSSFKSSPETAIDEIRSIIDRHLSSLREAIEK